MKFVAIAALLVAASSSVSAQGLKLPNGQKAECQMKALAAPSLKDLVRVHQETRSPTVIDIAGNQQVYIEAGYIVTVIDAADSHQTYTELVPNDSQLIGGISFDSGSGD